MQHYVRDYNNNIKLGARNQRSNTNHYKLPHWEPTH